MFTVPEDPFASSNRVTADSHKKLLEKFGASTGSTEVLGSDAVMSADGKYVIYTVTAVDEQIKTRKIICGPSQAATLTIDGHAAPVVEKTVTPEEWEEIKLHVSEDLAAAKARMQEALKNLNEITYDLLSGDMIFIEQVNFLNQFKKIEKYFPIRLLRLFYKISHRVIERNLVGKNPHLFCFDLYKIGYYSTLK